MVSQARTAIVDGLLDAMIGRMAERHGSAGRRRSGCEGDHRGMPAIAAVPRNCGSRLLEFVGGTAVATKRIDFIHGACIDFRRRAQRDVRIFTAFYPSVVWGKRQ